MNAIIILTTDPNTVDVLPARAAPRALLGILLEREDRAVVHFALEDFVGAAADLRSLIRAD